MLSPVTGRSPARECPPRCAALDATANRSAPTTRRRAIEPCRPYGTQWNASPLPVALHAPVGHPAQLAHWPPEHCESLVHQHGVPDAAQIPVDDVTLLQLPLAHDHAVAAAVTRAQFTLSAVPVPVHVPVHWLFALTHLPLAQSESDTQRHAVCAAFETGAGER